VTTSTGSAPGSLQSADGLAWHALTADRVLLAEGVDQRSGLSSVEVESRTQRFGANRFDTGKAESRWRAFLRQYADPMQIVLHLRHRRRRAVLTAGRRPG
jgi:magnesium-transporting ATPase (P-type)